MFKFNSIQFNHNSESNNCMDTCLFNKQVLMLIADVGCSFYLRNSDGNGMQSDRTSFMNHNPPNCLVS